MFELRVANVDVVPRHSDLVFRCDFQTKCPLNVPVDLILQPLNRCRLCRSHNLTRDYLVTVMQECPCLDVWQFVATHPRNLQRVDKDVAAIELTSKSMESLETLSDVSGTFEDRFDTLLCCFN
jgi:hypothetical protein